MKISTPRLVIPKSKKTVSTDNLTSTIQFLEGKISEISNQILQTQEENVDLPILIEEMKRLEKEQINTTLQLEKIKTSYKISKSQEERVDISPLTENIIRLENEQNNIKS